MPDELNAMERLHARTNEVQQAECVENDHAVVTRGLTGRIL